MTLSRKAKVWLVVLITPFVLLLGALGAAKLYFTSERLKAIIVPRLEAAIHRPVGIRIISLSLLPSIAVKIDSLTIANARGAGFSKAPLVSLERLTLKVRLAALIKGEIEITTILLERPQILIEVNEEGVANYAGMTAVGDTTGPPPGPAASSEQQRGRAFLLSNFQIQDGTIEFIDHQRNSATRAHGVNHTMRVELSPETHQIKVEGQTSIDRLSYGTLRAPLLADLRLTLDHQLLYSQDQDLLTIQKGVLTIQDMALSVSGTVAGMTKTPVLSVTVASEKLSIAELLSLIPREYMKKAEGLKGSGLAQVKLTVNGSASDSTAPDVVGTITATDASIQYPQLPKPITNVNLSSAFAKTRTQQEFVLEKFSANLGSNPLSASMRIVNFQNPSIALAVKASLNLSDVKDYYPLESGTELSGVLMADINIAGAISTPAAMKASGTMEFRSVTVKTPRSQTPVENLQGAVTFNNQIVESKRIAMTLGRSDLTLAFSLRNYLSILSEEKNLPKPVATLSLTSRQLYTADLSSEKGGSRPGAPAPQKSDEGQKKGGLVLPNVDMEVQASVGTLFMEKFVFTNLRASMGISNGTITLRTCTMNAFAGAVSTKGTLNVQKPDRPQFDFVLEMTNLDAHAMLPKFTSFGERMTGRLTMSSALKGSLDDTLGLVPQELNGRGRVQVQNGSLSGVAVNKAIASALKLPDLETIAFNDWANEFTVADGRIVIKDLKIRALDADYVVNGSQGLDGSLDYSMSLILPEQTSSRISIAGFGGQAVDMFRDNTGRVKLDFTVSGSTEDPKVALDTRAAQKKAGDLAKQKLTEEAKKLQDQLKSKGEDLLKGLLKKKK